MNTNRRPSQWIAMKFHIFIVLFDNIFSFSRKQMKGCIVSIKKINLTLKWPWSLTSSSRSRTYLVVKVNAFSISVVKMRFVFKKINLTLKWPWSLNSRSRARTYLDVKFNALFISVVKIWGSHLKKSMWHKLAPSIPYNFCKESFSPKCLPSDILPSVD